MTPRLSKEFKKESFELILNKSKQLILENFDKNNKYNKTIKIENDTISVEIRRNCFPHSSMPYFEDYHINFITTIKNEKIISSFYLEWKDNDMNTELIPADVTRKIKIEKW